MMREHQTKREHLTIYLIKDTKLKDEQIVKTDRAKPAVDLKISEGTARLYAKKSSSPKLPDWAPFLVRNQDVPAGLFEGSRSEGAVLLVRHADAIFALSFGMGYHLINLDLADRDFGLRVTLNSIDPQKLRSLDKASHELKPLHIRSQSSRDADIFDLNIDPELDMVHAVTGTSEVALFGEHICGRDALTINPPATLDDLPAILAETLVRRDKPLPERFAWIENVHRVRDSTIIECLDDALTDVLQSAHRPDNLWLGEPEIVDWETQTGYSFDQWPKTARYRTLELDRLIDYIVAHGDKPSATLLRSISVHVNDANYQSIKSWAAYRCLYAELPMGKETYILRNGLWYEVSGKFVDEIDAHFKRLEAEPAMMPVYKHANEGLYNESVASENAGYELLDKKNISFGNAHDKIEFCDLVRDGRDLIHVKLYRSSATLSHLFAQGSVSAETFMRHAGFRVKLNEKLPASIKLDDPLARPKAEDYRIVYAIATTKNLPKDLPFFSKITLKNAIISLNGLGFGVALARIEVDPAFLKTANYKPARNATGGPRPATKSRQAARLSGSQAPTQIPPVA
ncbi:TIGR04141 family sporadically distributed protein [Ralstonia pseudosolanacearum]|uniref:TIGR04141 family sporadically distributed protein n=1 Tax=Ralstonia pseudosolanacearum TaxID=1310165 RepID=UPI001FF9C626|nr:TIGR04141 family sporadically distributed protein [Ralstonia pseudosolanacearum]MDO3559859.1 TIGR04141 family sporadically distributed protein [Ralstonia pseudosolanacearum]MDO3572084.1 TIGR04141 family sporadically distributed protein [Ralstonia pseudosolanacearum]